MTHRVAEAARTLEIVLHDHIIIGRSREVSLRSAGYL
jgi:DNA repair protein RadC